MPPPPPGFPPGFPPRFPPGFPPGFPGFPLGGGLLDCMGVPPGVQRIPANFTVETDTFCIWVFDIVGMDEEVVGKVRR